MPVTIQDLNRDNQADFVAALGHVFEQSPWIAAQAWHSQPFADKDALHRAMTAVLWEAPLAKQLALIEAHPDLAGKAAIAGELTEESTREQTSAGLNSLTADEFSSFTRLNTAYRARFGFPFIICVREHDKRSILAAFEERLQHTREEEIAAALEEITRIARIRLQEAVTA